MVSRNYYLLALLFTAGCIEPFEPEVAVKDSNVLVVDGFINAQGASVIKLSRSTGLAENTPAGIESRARVFIEEETGKRYTLIESPAGTYQSAALSLPKEKLVRLHMTLASGKEYTSAYTPAKHTPAIDEVSWKPTNEGLQIAVNTHDETHSVRYYRWSYDETWEFTSAAQADLEYKNGELIRRKDNIYNCWGSESPTAIQVGTTTRLSEDIISQQPLTLLPSNSVKLRYKYSILVRQYALSAEEYSYWEALRKNTENIGTLFDPLPTQLTGNVHNVADASEPVIGFVGAQSVSEKRIFIKREQLPSTWNLLTGYESCQTWVLPTPFVSPPSHSTQEILYLIQLGQISPITRILDPPPGYYNPSFSVSYPECVDCRRRGTNVRPSFWE
ncbi:DUF4249 domain-containing protein [Hymenobacter fodinae]|uniref:DUF4249 domain-containing protein n=1 Tax=Hymenobacter fodinae TaxID=2510796 RepID=A0A4Z0PCR0_9BACT|nr:DUF4249 domain-containing protein [Hymenobacter fodinae]TGE10242.1 DUF4249 domain-containing protein [Hymenobacter fodinae]